MANLLELSGYKQFLWGLFLLILASCSSPSIEGRETLEPLPETEAVVSPQPETVMLKNEGGSMGGHTPRGFQGMGTGLFVGDNLNPRFPDGEGVQLFITFDLSALPPGKIETATLRTQNVATRGMPFEDLGSLTAQEVRFDSFSAALWNLEPVSQGASCEFATSADGPFACDLTSAIQRSIADEHPYAQFRLRLDEAGDSDGQADLVMFFINDSNSNEPGIFELEITLTQ